MPRSAATNCFTVDVEGFAESNAQSFSIAPEHLDRRKANDEIRRNMAVVLDLLAEVGAKGTFFCLGRLARELPAMIAEAAAAGHEIACHSYEHLRVLGTSRDTFREKLKAAKRDLEDASGRSVGGFRAPDFSITSSSVWALDVLAELGFRYDSSIYPIGLHDVYGISTCPPVIHRLPNGLIEFPLATFRLMGKRLPFGGGGYFRLYPLALTAALIRAANARGNPCMFYIHPYEVGPEIPILPGLSGYRRFRHYYHCAAGRRRLQALLTRCKFAPVADVLREQGFGPDREMTCATV